MSVKNPWPEKFHHKVAIICILVITWPIAQLPVFMISILGKILGSLFYYVVKERREIAIDNITKIKAVGELPENIDAKKLAKKSFQEQAKATLQIITLFHNGAKKFLPKIVFKHEEYYYQARKMAKENKQGIMLLTGHTGNWELMGQTGPLILEFKPTAVGRKQDSPVFEWLVKKMRTQNNNTQIYKEGAVLKMWKTLKEGGILVLLIDQATMVGNEGVAIDFLGLPAMTTVTPARLGRRIGAVIMPAFCRHLPKGGQEIIFYPPFELAVDPNADLVKDTKKISEPLEDFIKNYPDQWLWGHRRWKKKQK